MKATLSTALVSLCISVTHIHAYAIDSSCDNPAFVQQAAASAYDMAARAKAALLKQPKDPNVNRLIQLLFCGPNEAAATKDMTRAINVYTGIGKSANRLPHIDPTENTDAQEQVVIYCNLDRVTKRQEGDYLETATQTILEDFGERDLKGCVSGGGKDLAVTFAIATRENADYDSGRESIPSQITICPWFYTWARVKKFGTIQALTFKSGLAHLAIPLSQAVWPFERIDGVNLLDKVLLHELTHTVAAGRLEDVIIKKGAPPGFGGRAYGWKAAKALASQVLTAEEQRLRSPPSPFRNSDTLALFASGVRLLEKSPPQYVTDSGDLTKTDPTTRNTPRALQHQQTPADFERFIASIRAIMEVPNVTDTSS